MIDINAQDKYSSDEIYNFMFDRKNYDYATDDDDEPSNFENPQLKLRVNRTE